MVEPDFVKIDRDLVKDIGHDSYRQHMMKALIDYWLQQDVSIIAEGVETEEEVLFFKIMVSLFSRLLFYETEASQSGRIDDVKDDKHD